MVTTKASNASVKICLSPLDGNLRIKSKDNLQLAGLERIFFHHLSSSTTKSEIVIVSDGSQRGRCNNASSLLTNTFPGKIIWLQCCNLPIYCWSNLTVYVAVLLVNISSNISNNNKRFLDGRETVLSIVSQIQPNILLRVLGG